MKESFEKFFKNVDDSIDYDPKHHLAEDPNYYSKLEKMEKGFKDEN